MKEPHTHNSKALIANHPKMGGCFLEVWGDLEEVIDETGLQRLDDYGLDDSPIGLSIWEGDLHYEGEDDRAEAVLEDKPCRRLTDKEWEKFKSGSPLWKEGGYGWKYPDFPGKEDP